MCTAMQCQTCSDDVSLRSVTLVGLDMGRRLNFTWPVLGNFNAAPSTSPSLLDVITLFFGAFLAHCQAVRLLPPLCPVGITVVLQLRQ